MHCCDCFLRHQKQVYMTWKNRFSYFPSHSLAQCVALLDKQSITALCNYMLHCGYFFPFDVKKKMKKNLAGEKKENKPSKEAHKKSRLRHTSCGILKGPYWFFSIVLRLTSTAVQKRKKSSCKKEVPCALYSCALRIHAKSLLLYNSTCAESQLWVLLLLSSLLRKST